MSAIKAVLKEELNRLKILARKYKQELRILPKGSISKKERRGRHYAYLAFRKGDRVYFNYLGKPQSEKVIAIELKIRSRKEYESRLRRVAREIRDLEKIVYGRKK